MMKKKTEYDVALTKRGEEQIIGIVKMCRTDLRIDKKEKREKKSRNIN